ncbi:hypothetical protein ACFCYN_18775 [Gottfriedia sp. NPDC056225]|uniref:hypothetical protein n=1 Tax=Gottfriedia sp. NPDC056225 TaxID=3345751 RepID=UPI0035E0D007
MKNKISKLLTAMIGLCLLTIILTACGKTPFNGEGKIINIDLKEYQQFVDGKKDGFVYVKRPFPEQEKRYLDQLTKMGKEKHFNVYVIDGGLDLYSKYIHQISRTIVYYKEGTVKSTVDLEKFEKDQVDLVINQFLQDVKENE